MTVQIEFTNLLHHTSTVEFQTLETVITLTTVIISAKKYADGYPNLTYVLSIIQHDKDPINSTCNKYIGSDKLPSF